MLARILAVVALLCVTQFSVAGEGKAVNKNFVQGKHYELLETPLPVGVAMVVEFMYYGCKVCFQIAPSVAEWAHITGTDVSLIPAHSETTMVNEARMFHAFEVMGVLPQMYEDGYVIFQTNKSKLQGAERVNSFLEAKGIDKDKFWQIWGSEDVSSRLISSAKLTRMAKIQKTPTFVVHGLYKVDVESLKSIEELFALLTFLVEKKSNSAPALLRKNS